MADAARSTSSAKSEFQSRLRFKNFLLIRGAAAIDFASRVIRSKVIEKAQGNCMADTK